MSNQLVKQNGKALSPLKQIVPYKSILNKQFVSEEENEFQISLNEEPHPEWIKTNPLANNSKYIPIDKIEFTLSWIFIKWWVEVIDYKVIANSVAVHVRLFCVSPVDGSILKQDGLGAAPLQTDKGTGADPSKLKTSAVQMSLPAAETYAIKDAAEKFGRVFGKDLNRKDLMAYGALSGRFSNTPGEEVNTLKEIEEGANLCHDKAELKVYFEQLKDTMTITPEIRNIFSNRKTQLNGNVTA